jgi:hypothetical protein
MNVERSTLEQGRGRSQMDDDLFKEKGDDEFDEQTFGGVPSNQPLILRVRRIRNRGVVVIYWEVANWQGWENPIVFGRKYENHIPINMVNENEAENPSKPVILGSVQRVGTTGELKLAAGQTTYFGFWLKGRTVPKPKGLEWPKCVGWSSPEPITFPMLFRRLSCEKVAPAGQFDAGGRVPITCPL